MPRTRDRGSQRPGGGDPHRRNDEIKNLETQVRARDPRRERSRGSRSTASRISQEGPARLCPTASWIASHFIDDDGIADDPIRMEVTRDDRRRLVRGRLRGLVVGAVRGTGQHAVRGRRSRCARWRSRRSPLRTSRPTHGQMRPLVVRGRARQPVPRGLPVADVHPRTGDRRHGADLQGARGSGCRSGLQPRAAGTCPAT